MRPAVLTLLRFTEPADEVLPSDELGALVDLDVDAGLALPPVVTSFCGRGRLFSNGHALDALDAVPGATLATRDVTVQAILTWDITAQVALGAPGTIIARGKGAAIAEYVSYALELRVVNAVLGIGELRFWWQDTAGVVKTQLGGQFLAPIAGGYMLLTAVRRWVSSSQVELRYYAGDQLLAAFLSSDGDIGGGTTGTFCVGTRYAAGAAGRFFCGVIDELRVLNYELTGEEIAATWDRISRLQPRGYRAIRDLFPPEAPISDDPSSRVQRLFRLAGHGLGFAAAQIENARRNALPNRAYGPQLEEWEEILGEAPRGPDSVQRRRRRCVGHLRQHDGVSPPGVAAALADTLELAASQVQIIAFDQTVRDDFSAGLLTQRWLVDPPGSWSIAGGALRVQNAAAIPFGGSSRDWCTALQSCGGDGRAAHMLVKLVPTTLAATSEVGVVFYNFANGDALLLGLRSGNQIVTEAFRAGVSQGVTVQAALGGLPAALWLHLRQVDPGPGGVGFHTGADLADYVAAWSTVAFDSGYASSPPINHPSRFQWTGMYARTIGGAAAIDVSFDDTIMRAPFGDRAFRWYVLRDPALPGVPDLTSAGNAFRRMKHAQTEGSVITSTTLLYDDPGSLYDHGPAGGI